MDARTINHVVDGHRGRLCITGKETFSRSGLGNLGKLKLRGTSTVTQAAQTVAGANSSVGLHGDG